MRMAGLPQTSLIATSSRGRTVLLLMTINPDGPSITPHGPGLPWQRVVIDHPGDPRPTVMADGPVLSMGGFYAREEPQAVRSSY
jgi:hypothetical protein